jgi:hypothetical protein
MRSASLKINPLPLDAALQYELTMLIFTQVRTLEQAMSDRLALSSAFSVLMMACYVLFGGDAAQVSLGAPQALVAQHSVPSVLPQVSALLPR